MRFVVVIILAVAFATAAVPARAIDESVLPPCWSISSTYEADDNTLAGFGTRFGVTLESLRNDKIDAAGIALQVNTIVCQSHDDAVTVYKYFMGARQATQHKYIRDGHIVYEFLCDNHGARAKMQEVLGIRPKFFRKYAISFTAAPIEGSDDMKWNALFNALIGGGDVASLAEAFSFGTTLRLRNESPSWGAPAYEFTIAPVDKAEHGDIVEVSFNELPRTNGVPSVGIDAIVSVRAFSPYQPSEPVNAYQLTRPTDAWPTDDPLVAKALEEIDTGGSTMETLDRITCWVFNNIRYDGDVVGSRYGTARVLEQRFGHCWDKSDVFVTLCRAAGIPAREVMGWFANVEAGHVWAQAYDRSLGWISVDATTSWTGVDERYIPLFILEDGRTPFVYTSEPYWEPRGASQ